MTMPIRNTENVLMAYCIVQGIKHTSSTSSGVGMTVTQQHIYCRPYTAILSRDTGAKVIISRSNIENILSPWYVGILQARPPISPRFLARDYPVSPHKHQPTRQKQAELMVQLPLRFPSSPPPSRIRHPSPTPRLSLIRAPPPRARHRAVPPRRASKGQ